MQSYNIQIAAAQTNTAAAESMYESPQSNRQTNQCSRIATAESTQQSVHQYRVDANIRHDHIVVWRERRC